jgi:hypothetical protein
MKKFTKFIKTKGTTAIFCVNGMKLIKLFACIGTFCFRPDWFLFKEIFLGYAIAHSTGIGAKKFSCCMGALSSIRRNAKVL